MVRLVALSEDTSLNACLKVGAGVFCAVPVGDVGRATVGGAKGTFAGAKCAVCTPGPVVVVFHL